jgi:Entner-Doudoroff aldolase
MGAAIRGGMRVVEFTMNTPGALDLVAEHAAMEGLTVGAGTVLSPDDATAAVAAGARFLVSPVLDDVVVRRAAELGTLLIPGCQTPTEMWRAHGLGCPVQKLFPAPAGGPAHVRALLGPMPFLRLLPTQGVDASNVRAYLDAGAAAVGLGGALFPPEDVAAGRLDAIERRAQELAALVRGVLSRQAAVRGAGASGPRGRGPRRGVRA